MMRHGPHLNTDILVLAVPLAAIAIVGDFFLDHRLQETGSILSPETIVLLFVVMLAGTGFYLLRDEIISV